MAEDGFVDHEGISGLIFFEIYFYVCRCFINSVVFLQIRAQSVCLKLTEKLFLHLLLTLIVFEGRYNCDFYPILFLLFCLFGQTPITSLVKKHFSFSFPVAVISGKI